MTRMFHCHCNQENCYPSEILNRQDVLRKQHKFTDITLRVKNRLFPAHKSVLAASSPYFEALFTTELQENGKDFIDLFAISADVFEKLLEFVYTGSIAIDVSDCQEILVVADMLQLTQLKAACVEFLLGQLDPSNCLGIYEFAEAHCCPQLQEQSRQYFNKHFSSIVSEEEFCSISVNMLRHLLESEYLSIDNEYDVFTAVMSWIVYSPNDRCIHLSALMNNVRVKSIPEFRLVCYASLCGDGTVKESLLQYLNDIKNEDEYYVQPRYGARKDIYLIGGIHNPPGSRWTETQSLSTVEKYDTVRHNWTSLPSLHQARSSPGTACLNGYIYVVGGELDSLIHVSGECFNPFIQKWNSIPDMLRPRSCLGLCACMGYLFAFGGVIGIEVTNSIERYDPKQEKWTDVGNMTIPLYGMGVIEYEGLIYVCGGNTDGIVTNSIESYNPVTKEWKVLTSMNVPRAFMAITVGKGKIYVAGGLKDDSGYPMNTVEMYDIAQNSWISLPPMSINRYAASAAYINQELYIIGGKINRDVILPGNDSQFSNSLECYDFNTQTWTVMLDSLSVNSAESGVVVF